MHLISQAKSIPTVTDGANGFNGGLTKATSVMPTGAVIPIFMALKGLVS
ncbi:MAG TPA: hypothetical protein VHO69_06540 [Phototrophicaceae bacterium]|nr:hypothetical protein [Phototrophicaceae bacterium]